MKICVISPTSHVQYFSSHGDAEMALTHIILGLTEVAHSTDENVDEYQKNYIEYYKAQSEKGKFVILDNSAYEIGKLEKTSASGQGLSAELVLKAADIVKPSIVICQDVLCDKDATITATKEFIKQVEKSGRSGSFELMAVPQGRTKDEWLECYEELYKLPQIDMLGLSKISIPISFGTDQTSNGCVTNARLKCTAAIEELFRPTKSAHLLGGDNQLGYELSMQKKHSWIYSNDSSAAVWYGMHGQQFSEGGTIDEIITVKPDLENLSADTAAKLQRHRANILHNIATLHRLSKV